MSQILEEFAAETHLLALAPLVVVLFENVAGNVRSLLDDMLGNLLAKLMGYRAETNSMR
jgi:hypothetical protein